MSAATSASAPPSTMPWARPSTRRPSCSGLGFPGGPAVERAAAQGKAGRFELPRPMLGRPEPHFSFAGLKTAVRHKAQASVPLTDAHRRRPVRGVRGGGRRTAWRTGCAGRSPIADDRLAPARAAPRRGGRRRGQHAATDRARVGRGTVPLHPARPARAALHRQCGHGRVGGRRNGSRAAMRTRTRTADPGARPLAARPRRHPRPRRRPAWVPRRGSRPYPRLLAAQRIDRIQPPGPARRQKSEQDAGTGCGGHR